MTPDVQAAADHIGRYLTMNQFASGEVIIDHAWTADNEPHHLTLGHLRTLAAAVDQLGRALETERARTTSAEQLLAEASAERDVWKGRALQLNAALDPANEPIGHIPTQRGLDYLANRRQQHPSGGDQ